MCFPPGVIAQKTGAVLRLAVRFLSLDIGEKRIGFALSDGSGTIAQALKLYIRRSRSLDITEVGDLVRDHGVNKIVVGLPKNLDGSLSEKAREIVAFAESIERATKIPVDLWDERFSTDEAHRIFDMASIARKKRRASIDMMAAQIILQGYLDAQQNQT
jgi:putative holliday junction resolvase